MANPLLITVVGPTASGKSALAMWLAQRYNGEIICADSRTIYKGMDIGTAKPTPADQQQVRHHLLDILEPGQSFSAADFKRMADASIKDISSRGKLPIMVGGTGLYVDSVIFNYEFNKPADAGQREDLNRLTIEQLQQRCLELNITLPENPKNKRHLVRALETLGHKLRNQELRPNTIVVGIATDKDKLKEKIAKRAAAMVKEGIVEEVASLGKKYGWESEAMKGNIYKIFKGVVENTTNLELAVEQTIRSDLQLVKRQLTWLKRNPFIQWGTPEELKTIVADFLKTHGYRHL